MRISRWLAVSLFIVEFLIVEFGCVDPGAADTVYLKTNERIEGRVIRETEKEITLDFGFGEMVIDRQKIVKIEKGPVQPAKPEGTPAKGAVKPVTPPPAAPPPPPKPPAPAAKAASKNPANDKNVGKETPVKEGPPRRIGAAAHDTVPTGENTGKK